MLSSAKSARASGLEAARTTYNQQIKIIESFHQHGIIKKQINLDKSAYHAQTCQT